MHVTEKHDHDAYLIWEITNLCNLSCPYCAAKSETVIDFKEIPEVSVLNLLKLLKDSGKCCHIQFTGGEPFLVPNIVDVVYELAKEHYISINTNLLISDKIEMLCGTINTDRIINIVASVHLQTLENKDLLDIYLKNYHLLKDYNISIATVMVGYPPVLKKIEPYKEILTKNRIHISFMPFKGNYKNKIYPESYKLEEIQAFKLGEYKDNIMYKKEVDAVNEEPFICNAGYNSAVILTNGDIVRCFDLPQYKLGNINSGKLISFDHGMFMCSGKNCECPTYALDVHVYKKAKIAIEIKKERDVRSGKTAVNETHWFNKDTYIKQPSYCVTGTSSSGIFDYPYLELFNGTWKHPRSIPLVMRKNTYDIIHIVLNNSTIPLIEHMVKIAGPKNNRKTKIMVNSGYSDITIRDFITYARPRSLDFSEIDLVVCWNRNHSGIIRHFCHTPVHILPIPVDLLTVKSYAIPPQKRNFISFFVDNHESIQIIRSLDLQNAGFSVRVFYEEELPECILELQNIVFENLNDISDYEEFCSKCADSRFVFMSGTLQRISNYVVILAALGIPLVGDGLIEEMRRCYPSSLLYLKDESARINFCNRLISDDSFTIDIGKIAQTESSYYDYNRVKKQILDILFDS